ncbi:hypothetical protein MHK_007723 [Candidatus Magnetomorum sp. HK-1]|nr:hypothetical protein MHK_007723 [Candidatus Magnetomorum sp. HK-1]
MTISEYLTMIKENLLSDTLIHSFLIIKERSNMTDGHIRAKTTLSNGDLLEFSEYFQLSHSKKIDIITYSYHWTDKDHNLITRWDNAPHFPDLTNYPHHIHAGTENKVSPSTSIDFFKVIKIIAKKI